MCFSVFLYHSMVLLLKRDKEIRALLLVENYTILLYDHSAQSYHIKVIPQYCTAHPELLIISCNQENEYTRIPRT